MTFVAKVARWYGEGQMAEDLENFLQEFAAGVTTDTPEQSHENMEIYKKFQACVESGLAGFCKKEAITEQEFYKRCEEESSEETSSRILTAVIQGSSYESFLELVTEWKAENIDSEDD